MGEAGLSSLCIDVGVIEDDFRQVIGQDISHC